MGPRFFGVPNLSLRSPAFLQCANQGVVNNGVHLYASRGTLSWENTGSSTGSFVTMVVRGGGGCGEQKNQIIFPCVKSGFSD